MPVLPRIGHSSLNPKVSSVSRFLLAMSSWMSRRHFQFNVSPIYLPLMPPPRKPVAPQLPISETANHHLPNSFNEETQNLPCWHLPLTFRQQHHQTAPKIWFQPTYCPLTPHCSSDASPSSLEASVTRNLTLRIPRAPSSLQQVSDLKAPWPHRS